MSSFGSYTGAQVENINNVPKIFRKVKKKEKV